MAIQYLSQNGMQNVFRQWATADPNIASFGFGQLYDQNGQPQTEQRYPGMFVQPQRTDVPLKGYTVIRVYQILIFDVTTQARDNQNSIISDCEEFAFRLVRFLKSKSEVFDVINTPTIVPFVDKFLDDVCGVMIDVAIEFNAESANCEDPSYDFTIGYNEI